MTEEQFQATYSVRSLAKEECAHEFDCGDEDLNDFITNVKRVLIDKRCLLSPTSWKTNSKLPHISALQTTEFP